MNIFLYFILKIALTGQWPVVTLYATLYKFKEINIIPADCQLFSRKKRSIYSAI